MYYASGRKDGLWASQSSDPTRDGVYGTAEKTVRAIIREECGEQVLHHIDRSREGWNLGGNATFLDDIEVAIQSAYGRIAENNEYRAAGSLVYNCASGQRGTLIRETAGQYVVPAAV